MQLIGREIYEQFYRNGSDLYLPVPTNNTLNNDEHKWSKVGVLI